MKIKKTSFLIILLLLFTSTAIAQALYRKPLPSLPVSFNPKSYYDAYSIFVASQIYDRLFDFDELLNIKPKLVTTWSSEQNGKVWIFKLRPDVYFHNGKKFDANDVAFTLKTLLEKDSIKRHEFSIIEGARDFQEGKTKDVAGIKILTPDSIQISLTRPFPPFLSSFGAPNTEIIPNNYGGKSEAEFAESPIGTGAFKFAEYKKGEYLKLIANENYFLGAPKLKEIIFQQAKSEDALKGFNNGYYQDVERYYFSSNDIRKSYTSIKSLQANTNIITFNARRKPLDNVNFREAIAHAIDKKALVQACFAEQSPANSLVPPGLGGHYPDLAPLTYGLDIAKKKLKAAKLTPEQLKRVYTLIRPDNHPCQEGFAKFFESSMQKIGLNFKVIPVSFDKLIKSYVEPHNYDLINFTITADNPEAFFILNTFRSGYPLSFGGSTNKKTDEMLEQASITEDRYERFKIYRDIQKIFIDEALVIPIYYKVVSSVFQENVRGVVNPPLTDYISPMWPIYLEEKK